MDNKKFLKSYADAMLKASSLIKEKNPDYLIVPMMGSVPFVDSMVILDPDFDPSKAVYMPASSRIERVEKVIQKWYNNFLNDVIDFPNYFPKILGIDEVVSGNSVRRCFKSIDNISQRKRKELRQSLVEKVFSPDLDTSLDALRDSDILTDNKYVHDFIGIRNKIKENLYAGNKSLVREDSKLFVSILKDFLSEQLIYKTIGIEDSKKKGARNAEYNLLKKQKRIFPIGVDKILTMDKPSYCTARYIELAKPKGKKDYVRFSPFIKDFVVTHEYVNFLMNLANYVGRNPREASPVNMESIFNSSRYLNNSSNKFNPFSR